MLNLVLILLIAICFVWCCFFIIIIDCFPQFHPSIFVYLRFLLPYFFRFAFNGVTLVDSGHKYERFVRVWLWSFFITFFFQILFFAVLFFFVIYGVIPISWLGSCVWFVHLGWLPGSLKVFFNIFLYVSIISTSINFLYFSDVFGLF